MIGCAAARAAFGPWLDGELVGPDRTAIEQHLRGCAPCRAALEEERRLDAALRGAVAPMRAPEHLRARLAALAPRAVHPAARPRRLVTLAAAAVVALGAGAWVTTHRPAEVRADLVKVAAETHLRYGRGQLPLEVRSSRPETVSHWFEGRVPFHVVLPDYPTPPGERKPYALEGGRLVSLGDDYGAYVAYRMDGQPISLLVTAPELVVPTGDVVTSGALRFHVSSRAGLQVITWTDKGLGYALASDVSVEGARSCLVCHGSPAERKKLDGFRTRS